ncbi:hypothetical protein [Methylomagnum ishizawai]|uniref:hypothetical protein n=1 Tax=Methylomagnum ishizawai TaxID=1760988 RepID=UPI001C33112A|nr:hypothetical protein [Methylomagnum ishizawai]BBL75051.1 hypothetical protein MishRS11D_21490 [Methylomagnum ishizawai]
MNKHLLACFGLTAGLLMTGDAVVAASTDLRISMTLRKEIQLSDNSALYRLRFDLDGDPLKKARKISIVAPSRKRMDMQNPLHLNIAHLEVAESDYAYIIKTFPEGYYGLRVAPKALQGGNPSRLFLTHDFPAGLALVTPTPGATGLPTDFTAEWYPLGNAVNNIFVEITGPDVDYTATLPPTATRFKIPTGLLASGQSYRIGLGVRVQADGTGSHETVQLIDFTTAP